MWTVKTYLVLIYCDSKLSDDKHSVMKYDLCYIFVLKATYMKHQLASSK